MLTLARVQEATNTASMTRYLEEEVLPGTGWNLVEARRRYVRLDPPDAYWAVYRVRVGRGEPRFPEPAPVAVAAGDAGGATATLVAPSPAEAPPAEVKPEYPETRELRLVARAAFRPEAWQDLVGRLEERYGGRRGDPFAGEGYPVLVPEHQVALWWYPVDPSLPTLAAASDSRRVLRLVRGLKRELLDRPGRVTAVETKLVRYVPEISAILEYHLNANPQAASKRMFAKVQKGSRGQHTNEVMQRLWQLSERFEGRFAVPRPRGYYPELGVFLEDAAAGEAMEGDRTTPEFQAMAVAAAEAAAVIHDSQIETDGYETIEDSLVRLDEVLDQFALVHPQGHFLLRELLLHVRAKLAKTRQEEWVPTHNDLKYDQFLWDGERYTLIDFEYFSMTEESCDVARFCAYLTPSMPKGWEQSVAAEEARKAFLDRYRELRPDAGLQRFQLYEAVMLALRAMTAMWAQQTGWERAIETLLVMAMERLNTRLP